MKSYGSLEGVTALNPTVGVLSNDSTPTDTQVLQWLAQGYSTINRALSDKGYAIPVVASAAVYDELSALNNTFVVSKLYTARSIDIISGTDEDKATVLREEFERELKDLCESDLTRLGVSLAPVSTTTASRRPIKSSQLRKVDGYARLGI